MKKLLFKVVLFAAPFLVALLLELFVLPIDFFTFRAWEALRVKTYAGNLPGPFYPNMHLQTVEQGDLGHYTKYAVKKPVEWATDRFGYRKRDDNLQYNDIVIIGDSLTVGSGLTQDDTLAVVLSQKSNLNVYPLAPTDMITYQREQRFKDAPPKIVIVAYVERVIRYFPDLDICQRAPPGGVRDLRYPYPLVIIADRFDKANMLEFLRARMRDLGFPPYRGLVATDDSMLFLEGQGTNAPVEEAQLNKIVESVTLCDTILKEQGIQMIFLPVPNKESIYYDKLLNGSQPTLLSMLLPKLREQNIIVADLSQPYADAYRKDGEILFQPDDTHWNARGVAIAADVLNNIIESYR